MINNSSPRALRALPIQIIETGQGVILRRGKIEVKVTGTGAAAIVHRVFNALAHGNYTQEELCECFAGPEREAAKGLIEKLVVARMIAEGEAPEDRSEPRESHIEIFYGQYGRKLGDVRRHLNDRCLVILGVNYISRRLVEALRRSGADNFEVVDYPLLRNLRLFDSTAMLMSDEWPALKPPLEYRKWREWLDDSNGLFCLIATSDFGGHRVMRDWNRFCIERKQQFLPVVLQNLVGYIGPLVIPGETACYECLYARQNSHLSNFEDRYALEKVSFEGQIVNGFHPSMASVLGDLTAIELVKIYGSILASPVVGTQIEVNMMATQLERRKVLKIPRCHACSSLRIRSCSNILKTAAIAGSLRS